MHQGMAGETPAPPGAFPAVSAVSLCKKHTGEISGIAHDLQRITEGRMHGEAILKQAGENVG